MLPPSWCGPGTRDAADNVEGRRFVAQERVFLDAAGDKRDGGGECVENGRDAGARKEDAEYEQKQFQTVCGRAGHVERGGGQNQVDGQKDGCEGPVAPGEMIDAVDRRR